MTALSSLRCTKRASFHGAGGSVLSCLLQQFGLFEDKITGDAFVSLGFEGFGCLGWRVDQVEQGELFALSFKNVSAEEVRDRICILHVFQLHEAGVSNGDQEEPYEGIPWDI